METSGTPTPAAERHEALLIALGAAGYTAELRADGEPAVVEVRALPEQGGEPTGYSLYIWTLDVAAGEEGLYRHAVPRGRKAAWEAGLMRIALEHLPERNLYVAPPVYGARSVVAFHPEGAGEYLRSLPGKLRTQPGPAADEASSAGAIGRVMPEAYLSPSLDAAAGFGVSRPSGRRVDRKPIKTGFYEVADRTLSNLDHERPLRPAAAYYFWFGTAEDSDPTVETNPTGVPDDVPERARLAVEVFGFDGELTPEGATRGEVEVISRGELRVVLPAAQVTPRGENREDRLFFRVRTPPRPGRHRLRCNLYRGSTLLQSRLVTARVGGAAEPGVAAVESALDYKIAGELDREALADVPEHDLSISINGNAESHQLRLYSEAGEELFREEATILAARVKTAIDNGREALRAASWGDKAPWTDRGKKHSYRYRAGQANLSQMTDDLVDLARVGKRLFSGMATKLLGGARARDELAGLLATTKRIQIASAADGLYVPAALFYDHVIQRADEPGLVGLCEDFALAIKRDEPLEECPCMTSGCEHEREGDVVCPSGFWGFRHEIGWPPQSEHALSRIEYQDGPKVLIGISSDPTLGHRTEHRREVEGFAQGRFQVAESLRAFDEAMRARRDHVVYIYCHGGVDEEEAAFVALERDGRGRIDYVHLQDEGPWGTPPPRFLVFVNGCHTAALSPERMLDLVSGFVEEAEACGVVGTEITVFESLARDFAASMLPRFLGGESVGAAVRHARLELLSAKNPLGLVYVPFVAAETRLVQAAPERTVSGPLT